MKSSVGLVVLSLLVGYCFAQTHFSVSNTLGTNMVLQRAPQQANIWGWDAPGSTITLNFNNKVYTGTADETTAWSILLDATNAGGPYTISITSTSGGSTSFENVLFGDVWFCSGQSNMEFTVISAFNGTEEALAANNYPNIRVFEAGGAYSNDTQPFLRSIGLPWSVASNSTIGHGNWSYFSAACYFTGRNIYDTYGVPLGLISSTWGGTPIQAWSPAAVFDKCNRTLAGDDAWQYYSVLYNAMVYPFTPMSIKGVLWYQAEQNVGQASLYTCYAPTMVANWRQQFNNNFPFIFVQLASYSAGSSTALPDMRVAQLSAMSAGKVGWASGIDAGDISSPWGSVHSRRKQIIGLRLSYAVRAVAYGENLVWQGPQFQTAISSVQGSYAAVQVVWTMYGQPNLVEYAPVECMPSPSSCVKWQIQFNNGEWYSNVTATSAGNLVKLSMELPTGTTSVTGVRYGYSSWPIVYLYSEEGLPANPFQYFFSS